MSFNTVIFSRLRFITYMMNTADRTSPSGRVGCDLLSTVTSPAVAHTTKMGYYV